ncbi:SDR family NAD(P)-dependent oxidoreductase [Arthrobacter dokdonensis]|uniref:SDR family NAD(P)-dependent oxidoreductase n=1 Tax=Arthrobacter dokdonellae TaxID=2211210 RepID=UPI000DE58034|nr:SDR family NAD(P)-dependent oxidoreductase [Arthrobacter dokdonellae]
MSKSLIAIVGAGPGVSAGIARRFGSEGFQVVLLARRLDSVKSEAVKLKAQGIEAHAIVADAASRDSLAEAFAQVESEFGAPDVMVYNAGANSISEPSALSAEDMLNDFTINVAGALNSAQLVIPAMTVRGSGCILFTGGMLALRPVASRASAAISKAGLRNLAFTLADELAPAGITVGTVTIGGVVKPGTFFDPDLIAEQYWNLFSGKDQKEIVYQES